MKKGFLGVAGSAALLFTLFACSGEDGADGINGKDGAAGSSCEVEALDGDAGFKVVCDGDSVGVLLNGENGEPGAAGASCTASKNSDGDYVLTCGDKKIGTIKNGENGAPGEAGASCTASVNADGDFDLECDGKKVGTIKNGENGEPGANGTSCTASVNEDGDFDLECDGKKVGTIKNGEDGEPGANGTSCTTADSLVSGKKVGVKVACGEATTFLENGRDGADGSGCYAKDTLDAGVKIGVNIFCGASVNFVANGANGEPGAAGASCTTADSLVSGKKVGVKVTCGEAVVLVENGIDGINGDDCTLSDNGLGTVTITCGDKSAKITKALCGNVPFDPATSWCEETAEGPTVAAKCNGEPFDRAAKFCANDVLYDLCNDEKGNPTTYDPETEFCYDIGLGSAVVPKCGDLETGELREYELLGEFCSDDNKIHTRCAVEGIRDFDETEYKATTQFCHENVIYEKCERDGVLDEYNPETEFCSEGVIYEMCKVAGKSGFVSEKYNPSTEFCVARDAVYSKCNGETYDPQNKVCVTKTTPAYVADKLCGGVALDTATQFCHNGVAYDYCSGTMSSGIQRCRESTIYITYDPDEQYCAHVTKTLINCTSTDYPTAKTKPVCGTTSYNPNDTLCDSRDNQMYPIATVGTQTWMAQNLNFNKEGESWESEEGNARYGRLYTWATVMGLDDYYNTHSVDGSNYNLALDDPKYKTAINIDGNVQGICPAGWHVPKTKDYIDLIKNVSSGVTVESKTASDGAPQAWFKNTRQYFVDGSDWSGSVSGSNPYNLSFVPSGDNTKANGRTTAYLGTQGMWFIGEEVNDTAPYTTNQTTSIFTILNSSTSVVITGTYKAFGMAVRCVKD